MYKFKISAIFVIFAVILFPIKIGLTETIGQGEEYAIKNASLFLLPEKSSFLDPDYLTLDIIVNPGDNKMNAVNAFLSFDASRLELINTNMDKSFCSFIVSQNINNTSGNYDIGCTTLGESVSTASEVARLTFRKITAGWTKIIIKESSEVLAHDGLGTNILGTTEIHNIFLMK